MNEPYQIKSHNWIPASATARSGNNSEKYLSKSGISSLPIRAVGSLAIVSSLRVALVGSCRQLSKCSKSVGWD